MYKLESCCLSSHPISTKSLHLVLPTAFPDRNSKPRSSATDGGPDDVVADWGPKVTKLCPSLCHGNHITSNSRDFGKSGGSGHLSSQGYQKSSIQVTPSRPSQVGLREPSVRNTTWAYVFFFHFHQYGRIFFTLTLLE